MGTNVFNFFLGSDKPVPRKMRRCWLTYRIGLCKPKEKIMPLEISITNEQKVKVTLAPVTDAGKPAPLDGKPGWSLISGNAEIIPSEDGLSCDIVSGDTPGDSEILVEADAHLGEEVETVSDVIKVTVIGAMAKNLGLTVGEPELK